MSGIEPDGFVSIAAEYVVTREEQRALHEKSLDPDVFARAIGSRADALRDWERARIARERAAYAAGLCNGHGSYGDFSSAACKGCSACEPEEDDAPEDPPPPSLHGAASQIHAKLQVLGGLLNEATRPGTEGPRLVRTAMTLCSEALELLPQVVAAPAEDPPPNAHPAPGWRTVWRSGLERLERALDTAKDYGHFDAEWFREEVSAAHAEMIRRPGAHAPEERISLNTLERGK